MGCDLWWYVWFLSYTERLVVLIGRDPIDESDFDLRNVVCDVIRVSASLYTPGRR